MKELFQKLKRWWMAFAHALGWMNTRILLTLTYGLFLGLGAIVLVIIRKDLLHRRFTKQPSYWNDKEPIPHTLEQTEHQF